MRFANLLLVPALWTLLDPVVVARPQSNDRAAPPAPGLEDPEATPSRTRGEGASLVDPVVWGALLVTVFSIGSTYVIFNKAVARLRKEIDADKKKLRDDLREMDEKRKEDWKRLDEERRDAYTRLGHVHADLGEINRALLTTDFAEFSRQYLKAERCILTELGVFDSPDKTRFVNGDEFARAAKICGLSVEWRARYVPLRLTAPNGMEPLARPPETPQSGERPGEQGTGNQPSQLTLSPGNIFKKYFIGDMWKNPKGPVGQAWRVAPFGRLPLSIR